MGGAGDRRIHLAKRRCWLDSNFSLNQEMEMQSHNGNREIKQAKHYKRGQTSNTGGGGIEISSPSPPPLRGRHLMQYFNIQSKGLTLLTIHWKGKKRRGGWLKWRGLGDTTYTAYISKAQAMLTILEHSSCGKKNAGIDFVAFLLTFHWLQYNFFAALHLINIFYEDNSIPNTEFPTYHAKRAHVQNSQKVFNSCKHVFQKWREAQKSF